MCVFQTDAQSQGRRRAPIQPVGILDYSGEWFIKGEGHSDTTVIKGETEADDTTTREVEWLFEEGVEGKVDGYIYHPNFLEWRLGGRLTKAQQRTKIGDDKTEDVFNEEALLRAYDVNLLLLKEKPVSLQVFFSKDENLRDRDVSSSRQVNTERRGAVVRLKGKFPVMFRMERIESIEQGQLRSIDERIKRYEFTIKDGRNRNWLTELSYKREEIEKVSIFTPASGTGGATTQMYPQKNHEFNLTNLWRFGSGKVKKHSLSGGTRVRRRRLFYQSATVTADQHLRLEHSKSLSSFYYGKYETDETEGDKERRLEVEMGVTKKFFDSLDVTLRGRATRRTFETGLEKIAAGFLDVNYRKKTPLGLYSSSFRLGRQREEDLNEGDRQTIRDESVTLAGLDWSSLAQSNIVGGITVTDDTNTIPYFEGVDYILRTTGSTTEISRLLGGGIVDGETVLVDYSTEVVPESTVVTKFFTWGHRFKPKKVPIEFYVSYDTRYERLISGDDPGGLEQEKTILVGAELDYKGFTLAVEHEDHDQRLSPPTVADRVRIRYRKALGRRVSLSLGASMERARFLEPDKFELESKARAQHSVGANGSLIIKLTKNSLLRLSSEYSKTTGQDNRTMFSNGVSFEWHYRKLEFSMDADYNIETQEETQRNSASLMFYLKRKF